jgi:hypothetical protein
MKTLGVRDLKNKLNEYLPAGSSTGKGLYPSLPRKRGERRRIVAQWLDEERGTR